MLVRTFLKTGVEVLHLGGQDWESNAWPVEHWKANRGRLRLFTPGIDKYLNDFLGDRSFGSSIDTFVLWLEVADFKSWGPGVAFSSSDGWVSYKPKVREVWSVGQLDWTEIHLLSAEQQLARYCDAFVEAVGRIEVAKHRPKDYFAHAFAETVAQRLKSARLSELTRAAFSANEA